MIGAVREMREELDSHDQCRKAQDLQMLRLHQNSLSRAASALPKRPLGLTNRMKRSMAIEITSLYAAGRTAMLKDSSMPRIRPPPTAAVLLPSPPRIATVKPLIANGVPLSYCT